MIKSLFPIHRLLRIPYSRYLAHDLPHDPSGLLEKGRAEENIYFRKKEREELLRMRRKLERLERTQQQLEDKMERAQELIDKLTESKENKSGDTSTNQK